MVNISKGKMDMEPDVPNLHNQVKAIIKNDTCFKFYDETKMAPIREDAMGIEVVAGCYEKNGGNCGHDEVPDPTILNPVAFYKKNSIKH